MEHSQSPEQRRWARLYNGVTVLTISVAVLFAYAVLFVLVLLAAVVFVPGGYFQTTLRHPIGIADYLTLAWMATSGRRLNTRTRCAKPHTATGRDAAMKQRTPTKSRKRTRPQRKAAAVQTERLEDKLHVNRASPVHGASE